MDSAGGDTPREESNADAPFRDYDESRGAASAQSLPNGRASVSPQRGHGGGKEKTPKRQKLEVDGWAKLVPTGPALTAVVRSLGVRGVRVDQWYNVDVPEATAGRVHALILLYKWRVDRGEAYKWNPSRAVGGETQTSGGGAGDVMFVNQVINSGSATQSVVSALLNLCNSSGDLSSEISFGEELQELRDFVQPLPPVVRGAAVSSAAVVREAHNAAAAKQPPASKSGAPPETMLSEGFWLYTVYAPGRARKWVYELDGCGQDASLLGCSNDSDDEDSEEESDNGWVEVVTDTLEGRVKEMRQYRIPFELYALVDDVPPLRLGDESANGIRSVPKVSDDNVEGGHKYVSMEDAGKTDDGGAMSNGDVQMSSRQVSENGALRVENGASFDRKPDARDKLAHERHISTHNYDAFFVEMLKLMASKGQLIELVRGASDESGERNGRHNDGGNAGEGERDGRGKQREDEDDDDNGGSVGYGDDDMEGTDRFTDEVEKDGTIDPRLNTRNGDEDDDEDEGATSSSGD